MLCVIFVIPLHCQNETRILIKNKTNMKPMNNKQEAAFAYLVLQFSFVRPLEQMLRNLNEGIYEYGSQQDMKVLNETLQDCVNVLLKAFNINLECPALEGAFSKENEQKFIKYFTLLKLKYQEYSDVIVL